MTAVAAALPAAQPAPAPRALDMVAAMAARRSWRRYNGRPLSADARAALLWTLAAPPAPPFSTRVRLALTDDVTDDDAPQRLGTYGMISGARTFLVGTAAPAERALEDFGFVFEWALLRATALGLGTCWLGATLRRERFAAAVNAARDELVLAASPVGTPTRRRRISDTVFRWAVRSRRRRPWSRLFFDAGFAAPLTPAAAGAYEDCLEMVRLGPSAMNNQPWRVVRSADEPGRFDFYLRRARTYQKSFSVDLQRIDLGVALCHFELTARARGLAGGWVVDPPALEPPPRTGYCCSWRSS